MSDNYWQKSSYSAEDANCVEMTNTGDQLRIRESDAPRMVIATNAPRLRALLHNIKTRRLSGLI
ncbi:DUF397 domain-containing protein [Streptomyces mayteni]